MSPYEKESRAGLFEYDENTVTFDNSASFDSLSTPAFSAHLFPPALESNSVSDDESIPYMPGTEYAGSPFQVPGSPTSESPSSEAPEIMSFSPTSGPDGCRLAVYLQSAYDLLAAPNCTFALNFGSARCKCAVTPLGFHNSAFQYALLADAPAFTLTGCPTLSVPLHLVVDAKDGSAPHVSQIGNFIYDQELAVVGSSPPRKRRISSASDETSHSTGSQKQVRVNENMPSFAYNGGISPTPYSPYLASPASTCAYSPVQYQPSVSPSLIPAHADVQQQHMAQLRVKAPSPLSASWSPAFSAASASSRSPTLSATPIHGSGVATPVKPTANPLLVRTSTIQQSLAGSSGSSHSQSFNPYAMYPSKAVLKLNGDLDKMAEDWTKEERVSQRRLVQFTRRQEGSTIYADFRPVAPADRLPNSICISCINWEGKDECYVTSVDTIYLLECLVGVRFTVEEKNRIRRNLEGFRPLTVSKTKPESEEFFKVIMGFPNPKPRNIEKDVKVFPWRILAHALKKIIGKYSASYSSTAGALPSSLGSNYPSGAQDTSIQGRTPSPRGLSDNPSAYGANPGMFKWSSRSSVPPSLVADNSQVLASNVPLMVPNGTSHPMMPYGQQRMHYAPMPNVHGSYAFVSSAEAAPMTTVPSQNSGYLCPPVVPAAHGLAPSPIITMCQTTAAP